MKWLRYIVRATFVALIFATSASAQSISQTYPGNPSSAGNWRGFADSNWYLVQGGRQPTMRQVAQDLTRNDPTVFASHYARTQFIRMSRVKLGNNAANAESIARLLSSNSVRTVACQGTLRSMAYNDAGAYRWFNRDCVRGELIVQVNLGGRWVDWFSLGCLNITDGQVVQQVADPCPYVWRNPRGVAVGSRQMVIWVPAEARACLPPTLRCASDCMAWARGQRGRPDDPAIAAGLRQIVRSGGMAYYLDRGMTEIRLPASAMNLSAAPIWCDRRFHGTQEAEFMKSIHHDPRR